MLSTSTRIQNEIISPSNVSIKDLDCNLVNASGSVRACTQNTAPNGLSEKLSNVVNGMKTYELLKHKTFNTFDNLRYEDARLATFIDWPLTFLQPAELASDGFYYMRHKDHTVCFFCRGVIGKWEEGDTARGEHKRHFPQCPFVRNLPVGNVPSGSRDTVNEAHVETQGEDVCGSKQKKITKPIIQLKGHPGSIDGDKTIDFNELGISPYHGPKREEFDTLEKRLRTYKDWPDNVSQKPKDLAEAGFFYCGLSDHVRCYFCGKGVRNWEKEDDPWVEHAFWYPECNFILLKKGTEFVQEVKNIKKQKYPGLDQPSTSSSQGPSSSRAGSSSSGAASNKVRSITEDELDKFMNMDVIKAVLQIGFSSGVVRRTLKKTLETLGEPFTSLDSCIEAVILYLEEESMSENKNTPGDVPPTREASEDTPPSAVCGPATTRASIISTEQQEQNMETNNSNTADENETQNEASESEVAQHEGSISENVESLAEEESSPGSEHQDLIIDMDVEQETLEMPEIPATIETQDTQEFNESPKAASNKKEDENKISPQASFDSLNTEYNRLRDMLTCKVCMDGEADVAFLPCRHMLTCGNCALSLTKCPLCREEIKYATKFIRS